MALTYELAPWYPERLRRSARLLAAKFDPQYRAWFEHRFLAAIKRAKDKWGYWPSQKFATKLYGIYKGRINSGSVGNSQKMFNLQKRQGVKANIGSKTPEERLAWGARMAELRRTKKYRMLLAEAEARRAKRGSQIR